METKLNRKRTLQLPLLCSFFPCTRNLLFIYHRGQGIHYVMRGKRAVQSCCERFIIAFASDLGVNREASGTSTSFKLSFMRLNKATLSCTDSRIALYSFTTVPVNYGTNTHKPSPVISGNISITLSKVTRPVSGDGGNDS